MTAVCEFDEATHEYKRDGVVLPSVTRIIDTCFPRDDAAPEDMIEGARLRGEWVDSKFAEYLTTGNVLVDPAEFDSQKIYDEYLHCLQLAVTWWDKERPRAKVQCQVRLFGEKEAGTADFIVDDHEIIDLKSTYSINKKKVTVQLGGYGDLYEYQRWNSPDYAPIADEQTYGVLHVVKRLKNAQYKPIDGEEARKKWAIVRDYWRLRNE